MYSIKLDKFLTISEIAKEISKLQRGDYNKLVRRTEEEKRMIKEFATITDKKIEDLVGKKISCVCGCTSQFGTYARYKRGYEETSIFEGKVKNVGIDYIVFENNKRVRKERFYCLLTK